MTDAGDNDTSVIRGRSIKRRGEGETPMELLATAACVVPITSGVLRTNRMYDLSI